MTKQSSSPVIIDMDTARLHIDDILQQFFHDATIKAGTVSPYYEQLWKAMSHLILSGGKRFRPYMTMMIYQAFSGQSAGDVAKVAAAQELLHQALLIHDDIIDRDSVRYGVKNVSKQYEEIYEPLISDNEERRHFSDSAALLAGDLLIAAGYPLIRKSDLTAQQITDANDVFDEAVFVVAGGELLDTESAFRTPDTTDALAIARYKTAHYSFVTPIVMGATLGGAAEDTISQLETFGEHVGVAYQLVDDLLGIFGSQSTTGKSDVSDIEEGKRTYLIEQFERLATPDQQMRFNEVFGKKPVGPTAAHQARTLLIDSGAKQHVEQTIAAYRQNAAHVLDSIDIPEHAKATLHKLVEKALDRTK
jgi:geranylgeranyl diphosphate synthase, type II